MKRKPGYTIDEHKVMAKVIRGVHAELQTRYIELCSKYPMNSRLSRLAESSVKGIERLRCELDNVICSEHPEDRNIGSVYY